jgi:hypothetical protein
VTHPRKLLWLVALLAGCVGGPHPLPPDQGNRAEDGASGSGPGSWDSGVQTGGAGSGGGTSGNEGSAGAGGVDVSADGGMPDCAADGTDAGADAACEPWLDEDAGVLAD